MYKFVLRRLLLMIPIIIGVSFVIFTIMNIIPGDPGRVMLGPSATQEAVDKMNEMLGADDPFFQRYTNYIGGAVLHFDFGTSYMSKAKVFPEIMSRLPGSALLALIAIIFACLVGIPIGALSAVKQNSLLDTIPSAIALLLASLPTFLIGMVFMLFFALQMGWLPSSGTGTWQHYVLPVISLGLPYAGYQLRFTRSNMLETIRQDYIRTARAKGAPERDVIWKHAMKNALLPVITIAGNNFGLLIGGAVVIESLFGLPGLGLYIVTGIFQRDVPVVMGSLIVFSLMFCIVVLIIDVIYAFVDPRIKAKYSGRRG